MRGSTWAVADIELGLLVADAALAESTESLMRAKHGVPYERVCPTPQTPGTPSARLRTGRAAGRVQAGREPTSDSPLLCRYGRPGAASFDPVGPSSWSAPALTYVSSPNSQ